MFNRMGFNRMGFNRIKELIVALFDRFGLTELPPDFTVKEVAADFSMSETEITASLVEAPEDFKLEGLPADFVLSEVEWG